MTMWQPKPERATLRRGLTEHHRLLSAFANSPSDTGAVAPSSPWLAEALVDNAGLDSAHTIVELGAGTGVMTRAIEARAGLHSIVIAFELNSYLAGPLVTNFPRLQIVNDCAEHMPAVLKDRGLANADVILSALPWASFSTERQHRVLDAVEQSLKPGGRFCTVAYLHATFLPAARRFRQELKRRFTSVERSPVVWRNLPPAFVYRCH